MKPILFAALLLIPALLLEAAPGQQHRGQTATQEELQQQASALKQQIQTNHQDPELYMRLGFTYARLEQADDAQNAFEGAVKLDPKKAAAHYMLGLIYEKKGLRGQAIAAWNACLENTQDPHMRDTAIRHLHHLSH